MKRSAAVLLLGAVLAGSGLLLRLYLLDHAVAGGEAYRRGDFTAAAEHFEKALKVSPDPGRTLQNLAAALYRLDRFADAGSSYERASQLGDEARAARATYDGGNCSLHQACGQGGTPDAALLDEAIAMYREVVEWTGPVSPTLADDARHNLELAKLLAAQITPPGNGSRTVKNEEETNSGAPPPHEKADGQDQTMARQEKKGQPSSDGDGPPKPESRPDRSLAWNDREPPKKCPECGQGPDKERLPTPAEKESKAPA